MRCLPRPAGRAGAGSAGGSCRHGWWSTTSWPWRSTRRPASYGEVLRCRTEGVRCWLRLRGAAVVLADKSAIAKARVRLGTEPLKALSARVACPLAEAGTPGAWYRDRRLVGLDGTAVDPPDAPALEQRFGRPSASVARRQQLSPAAPADADRDRHARDLRRRHRPLRGERGRAGPGTPAAAAARHAVPGRPRLRRLRAVARGRRHRRRPALAAAQEPGSALPRAAAGRLVPQPPLRLAQASSPRRGRGGGPGRRLRSGRRAGG